MIIGTRDFGEIEISEESVYHFSQPVFGFEEYTDYVLLHDEEIGGDIVWLQSTQKSSLCFIMMDPGVIINGTFAPELPKGSEKLLGEGIYVCWVIAVIPQNIKDATANLKSPVFLNPDSRLAAQIILEGDYPLRFPITNGGKN